MIVKECVGCTIPKYFRPKGRDPPPAAKIGLRCNLLTRFASQGLIKYPLGSIAYFHSGSKILCSMIRTRALNNNKYSQ